MLHPMKKRPNLPPLMDDDRWFRYTLWAIALAAILYAYNTWRHPFPDEADPHRPYYDLCLSSNRIPGESLGPLKQACICYAKSIEALMPESEKTILESATRAALGGISIPPEHNAMTDTIYRHAVARMDACKAHINRGGSPPYLLGTLEGAYGQFCQSALASKGVTSRQSATVCRCYARRLVAAFTPEEEQTFIGLNALSFGTGSAVFSESALADGAEASAGKKAAAAMKTCIASLRASRTEP